MKLLILTQKVDMNDDVLGFMHGWIHEFSKNCEKVIVICLQRGEYDLPNNVKVLSLGKEHNNFQFLIFNFQIKKIKYFFNFYKFIWQERKNYDAVFVHMNHEYVILGGWLWKILKKKIGLWYAHGYVPRNLKRAEKLADIIFTSTQSGFRLASKKVKVIGQGIDTEKFQMSNDKVQIKNKIISVGRVSPVKNYETLIEAVKILNGKGVQVDIEIIGGAGTPGQEKYFNDLKEKVANIGLNNQIKFIGQVPNRDILPHLQNAKIFANMSQTGSLDKAMVEAMAVGLPVVTCNEAMIEVLGKFKDILMYAKNDALALAQKIEFILNLPDEKYEKLGLALRKIVEENHSLEKFVKKIISYY